MNERRYERQRYALREAGLAQCTTYLLSIVVMNESPSSHSPTPLPPPPRPRRVGGRGLDEVGIYKAEHSQFGVLDCADYALNNFLGMKKRTGEKEECPFLVNFSDNEITSLWGK